MAEEKKSIEISYKANLKDLISKLKTIPNLTDQEAKKMVRALDRQLKQAEKAAKKQAEASKKAAQAASKAARKAGDDFQRFGDKADKAEQKLRDVAESSGDIDRGFSSVGLALREVNPQLAEAADGLADSFAVVEGLTMSFSALNPLVVAGAVALGTLTLGFMSHKAELERVKQLTLDLRDAQKGLNEQNKGIGENLRDALAKMSEQEELLDVLTGNLTEYEFQLKQAQRTQEQAFESNLQAQRDIINERKADLSLVQGLLDGNRILSDEEKERLRTLQLLVDEAGNNLDLTQKGLREEAALTQIRRELNIEIDKHSKGLEIIQGFQERAVEASKAMVEFEHETTTEKERQKGLEEDKAEAAKTAEDQAKIQLLIEQDLARFKELQKSSEEELARLKTELSNRVGLAIDREATAINLKYDNEIKRIKELAEKTNEHTGVKEAVHSLETQKEQELHALKLRNREQIMAIDTDITDSLISDLSSISSDLETVYSNLFVNQQNVVAERVAEREEFEKMSAAEQERVTRQRKIMLRFFRAEQALSIAQIGMNTAEAITKAQAVYAPGTPASIAATILALATGATQAAVVASKQPPTFHMGGMAPDEMGARVLRGEAILDRATVRRLGGEQGVKELQQKPKGNETVVVIQPFKHFGRFTKAIGFVPPNETGIKSY